MINLNNSFNNLYISQPINVIIEQLKQAVKTNNIQAVKELLCINKVLVCKLLQENTDLFESAIRCNKFSIAKIFSENGARLSSLPNRKELVPFIIPILSKAVQDSDIEFVKSLLEEGADIKNDLMYAYDEEGTLHIHQIAAHIACSRIIKLFIENADDVNADNGLFFCTAIKLENFDLIKLCFEKGAQVNSKDKNHKPMLAYAIDTKNAEIVKLFIENGADVTALDEKGNSMFTLALETKDLGIIKLIFNKKDYVNCKEKNGDPFLLTAIHTGNVEVVRFMIDAGAKIDVLNGSGYSIIRGAINFEIFKLLIDCEINLDTVENNALTVLEVILNNGTVQGIKYLIEQRFANRITKKVFMLLPDRRLSSRNLIACIQNDTLDHECMRKAITACLEDVDDDSGCIRSLYSCLLEKAADVTFNINDIKLALQNNLSIPSLRALLGKFSDDLNKEELIKIVIHGEFAPETALEVLSKLDDVPISKELLQSALEKGCDERIVLNLINKALPDSCDSTTLGLAVVRMQNMKIIEQLLRKNEQLSLTKEESSYILKKVIKKYPDIFAYKKNSAETEFKKLLQARTSDTLSEEQKKSLRIREHNIINKTYLDQQFEYLRNLPDKKFIIVEKTKLKSDLK